MAFQKDKYYKISSVGSEALTTSEMLLKSYPLSKTCLQILGKKLLDQLEFGFFSPGRRIITQGEKGKDLFLFCNHLADVIVLNKVVVQMPAPTLVGDKGIVDRQSVRTATVAVAKGKEGLVIKIPMGLFIRNFKNADIGDAEYRQEINIYYNLFLEIQKRLFKYSKIQKNLWEEVNTQLNSLNIQLITNILNKQEEKPWDAKAWGVVRKYLLSVHRYAWSESTPLNQKTLNEILREILETTFPRKAYKGTDRNYAFQKQLLWKKWLDSISELVVKVLPNDQLPINLGEIELFNPRIYQMRMHKLLRSIEKKFIQRKVKPREGVYDSVKMKASVFFGKKVDKNEFNMDAYLATVKKMFVLKNPNRILAQLAQQIAQLSATCENEFNTSVSKMQHFLEKVQKISAVEEQVDTNQKKDVSTIEKSIAVLNQGFKAYNKRIVSLEQIYIGQIRYSDGNVPLISDIVKSCGSDHMKKNSEKAFQIVLDLLDLNIKNLSKELLKKTFHICQAGPEDKVPASQFATHYWIPVSEGFSLMKGKNNFGTVKPGTILGGEAWELSETEEDVEGNAWYLRAPKRGVKQSKDHMFMIMVCPAKKLPWRINKEPLDIELLNTHVPVGQWMIDKHIEYLLILNQLLNIVFQKYSKVAETVLVEKKVREFEGNKKKIPSPLYKSILTLVEETLGFALEPRQGISTEDLSKQIYNHLVKQTKRDFPNLTIEEQGNKAYTLWRFIQSEIVSTLFLKESAEKAKLASPLSVFSQIKAKIVEVLKEESLEIPAQAMSLTDEEPYIYLTEILRDQTDLLPDQKLEAVLSILSIVENQLRGTIEEILGYQARLKEISAIKTEFDVQEIQLKFIHESIAKLKSILDKKFSEDN
ncbi:MAG: hypothetical protein GY866_08185 [Proteobacteria bacterium]|nr:hypothetical protein [Pseudomonadota bacterium]